MKIQDEKLRTGNCPDEIMYILKVRRRDDQPVPAFPARSSPDLTTTQRGWAIDDRYRANVGDWTKQEKPEVLRVANAPITKARIMSAEVRGEGGRAYKLAIWPGGIDTLKFPHGLLVDLREDVIIHAITTCGVNKNGWLPASLKLLWVRSGSQMRLTWVGSERHKSAIELGEKAAAGKQAKRLPTNDLKEMYVYETQGGEAMVYLGRYRIKDGSLRHGFVQVRSKWSYRVIKDQEETQQRYNRDWRTVTMYKSTPYLIRELYELQDDQRVTAWNEKLDGYRSQRSEDGRLYYNSRETFRNPEKE